MKPLRRAALFLALLAPAAPAAAQTADDGFKAYDAGDYEKAKAIFLPLAEHGDPKAMNAIGLMYDFGKGYPKNATTACDWYEKAAGIGYLSAQRNLGACYIQGQGRPKSLETGLSWVKRAANSGSVEAQLSLFSYYDDANNKKEAQRWLSMAMSSGSTVARVSGWVLGYKNTGTPISLKEVACFYAMNVIAREPFDYCD
ncbi:MAG: tetratricopeptide repeat protein [Rhodospirillaceae bacterium]